MSFSTLFEAKFSTVFDVLPLSKELISPNASVVGLSTAPHTVRRSSRSKVFRFWINDVLDQMIGPIKRCCGNLEDQIVLAGNCRNPQLWGFS
jgi:hypothetical protein